MDQDKKKNSFLLSREDVNRILDSAPIFGKHILEPLKTIARSHDFPFNVIELSKHTGNVELHKNVSDVWFCLQGEVTFLCGGVMEEPHIRVRSDGTHDETELRAKHLEGAEEIIVRAGDWFWIAAGEPHQHITEKTARLMIIKVPRC